MIDKDKLIQNVIDFEGRYEDHLYITVNECKKVLDKLEVILTAKEPERGFTIVDKAGQESRRERRKSKRKKR